MLPNQQSVSVNSQHSRALQFDDKILDNLFNPADKNYQHELLANLDNPYFPQKKQPALNQELLNVLENYEYKYLNPHEQLDEIELKSESFRKYQSKEILDAIAQSVNLSNQSQQFQFMESLCNKIQSIGSDSVSLSQFQSNLQFQQLEEIKQGNPASDLNAIKELKTIDEQIKFQIHKKNKKTAILRKDREQNQSSASEYNPQIKKRKRIKNKIKTKYIIKRNLDSAIRQKNKPGCMCKKTKCEKKYCECFHTGKKCTESCHCEECQNQ